MKLCFSNWIPSVLGQRFWNDKILSKWLKTISSCIRPQFILRIRQMRRTTRVSARTPAVLLHINDLPRCVNAGITFFTADTNIFHYESNSARSLPDILKDVYVWMKSIKLKCNLDKSKVVPFGRKTADVELGDFGLSVEPSILVSLLIKKSHSKTTSQKISQNVCSATLRLCEPVAC